MEELGTSIESCPCGHVYHKSCIRHWIVQKRVCPQCKGDALPLISLSFNLFHLSSSDRKATMVERLGSLQADLSSLSLNIDNEVSEINILEPQLAQAQEEETAYQKGIQAREARKNKLENEFETAHTSLLVVEERRQALAEHVEGIRGKISRSIPDIFGESTSSRRTVQTNDIPKLISFIYADYKKLSDLRKESQSLSGGLTSFKSKSLELKQTLRSIGPNIISADSKQLSRAGGSMREGFIPIDSIGNKRRREEDRLKEIDRRRPSLFERNSNEESSLRNLSLVVSILSDGEDLAISCEEGLYANKGRSQESKSPKQASLGAFFHRPDLVVLD